ncbi:MAG: ACT domain-containing protein [Kiritimatiellia bacterium]|jgi:hypothetical protein
MKIPQLSIFLENKPGHLNAICRTLADAGVSITTLSLADTQQFGLVRIIVRDWEYAKEVLEKAGFLVNVRQVVAVKVPDRAGGLVEMLDLFTAAGVNIEYMYAFTARSAGDAMMVFRFDDPDKAIATIQDAGRSLVDDPSELFG